MRKTKIICTLGPATQSAETLRALIRAGANVLRLNMSHAEHDWVREIVPRIRALAKEAEVVVGIMMDTQGPAIRTGDLPAPIDLQPGDAFEFTVRGAAGSGPRAASVNYDGFIDDVAVGDTVLVDNGNIRMKVLQKENGRVQCEVLTAGTMGSRRHINLPGVKVNLPALTEKDLKDVALAAELHVDFVALSFCREPADVELLRAELRKYDRAPRIVAKIEDQLALRNLNGIIRVTDVVMVARGDLGIECPMEDLPIIQRRIVKRCLLEGAPVIVATNMLESMIHNPAPTRAEVTDVANAVYEQADAIMLSGETTIGKYPVQCVEVMDKVAQRIERSGGAGFAEQAYLEDDRKKTVRSAVALANSLADAIIVIFTRHGTMADYVSNLRPRGPIHAFAASYEVVRKLSLNWGTYPRFLTFDPDPNRTIGLAIKTLLESGVAKSGGHLVIVSDMLAGEERFDTIQLRVIP